MIKPYLTPEEERSAVQLTNKLIDVIVDHGEDYEAGPQLVMRALLVVLVAQAREGGVTDIDLFLQQVSNILRALLTMKAPADV